MLEGPLNPNAAVAVKIGELNLEIDARRLWGPTERRISLTESEMDLLLLLVRWRGRPLSRNEIRLATRGRPAGAHDRSVDVMVLRLRRKLGAFGSSIQTVPNAGYLLVSTIESEYGADPIAAE